MTEQHTASETQAPEKGSIEWYLRYSGSFVKSLLHTVQRADPSNLGRLRLAYPQVVAAIEMPSWYKAPPGFDPDYQAYPQEAPHRTEALGRVSVCCGAPERDELPDRCEICRMGTSFEEAQR